MKHESLKSLRIILVLGLVAAVIAVLLTGIVKEPTITEHDFHYSVTYKLDGEVKTMDGIYRSRFTSTGKGTNPLERYYDGSSSTIPPRIIMLHIPLLKRMAWIFAL